MKVFNNILAVVALTVVSICAGSMLTFAVSNSSPAVVAVVVLAVVLALNLCAGLLKKMNN